jgi:hypothetical protein
MKSFKRYLEYLEEKRVDTTATAAYTELFPALAFNHKFRPSSAEDLKKFVYQIKMTDRNTKKTFINPRGTDPKSAEMYIDKMSELRSTLVNTKLENAIGVTNFLYDMHRKKPISRVQWGFRDKPKGAEGHPGDIFVTFTNGDMLGISLKAGEKKSKEPLLNSYVSTQYKNIGKSDKLEELEHALWDSVYSKIPGVSIEFTKDNYTDKNNKSKVRQLYLDFFLENQEEADNLYKIMNRVCREKFCDELNTLSIEEFKEWVYDHFNLQKPQTPPLILVKAIGSTAEQKGDDLASILPLVTSFEAYLNTESVQEWFIDIETPEDKKRLNMVIRSDSGVRANKKLSQLGKLGQFTSLKLLYNGIQDA